MNHEHELSRTPIGARTLIELLSRQLDDCEPAGDVLDRAQSLELLLGPAICRQLAIYRLPADFLLSVVIPVFNEEQTVAEIIARVRNCGLPCEIIVINDGSSDDTRGVLDALATGDNLRIVHFANNTGKGAALKAGFELSRGDVVVVQDADLEYDPTEIWRLIQPIVEGQADVVFGSRFLGDSRRVVRFWHFLGNHLLTLLSNLFTNLNLSDMETCYKVFRGDLIRRIAPQLREKRFGIEPELTARIARIPRMRVYERSIRYSGRTYAEGKKINWRDGLRAVWCIFRYGLIR